MSGHWESIANAAKSRADLRRRLAAATTDNRSGLPAIVKHLVQGFERLLGILFVAVIERLVNEHGTLRVLVAGLARFLSTARFGNWRHCGSTTRCRYGFFWLPVHDHKAGIKRNVLFQLVQFACEGHLYRHTFVTHPGSTHRHHWRKAVQCFPDIAVVRQGIDSLKHDIHSRRLTYLACSNRVAAGIGIGPAANNAPRELFRVCCSHRLFRGIHAHSVKYPACAPLTTRATNTHQCQGIMRQIRRCLLNTAHKLAPEIRQQRPVSLGTLRRESQGQAALLSCRLKRLAPVSNGAVATFAIIRCCSQQLAFTAVFNSRSEERRVGKECRYRWWP